MNIEPYTFRRVTAADLPMLRRWLQAPEVRLWWGDPDEQAALIEDDFGNPELVMRLVLFDGRPFAYAQDYDVRTWPQPHLADLPAGSRAIDTFVGEPDMIGGGHGSAYLRLLAGHLSAAGAPLVAIDPDPENLRARRAYERAGFVSRGRVETDDGPADLMIFDGNGGA